MKNNPNVFPTAKTDTYYTEKGRKTAFAVVYDDGNGGRAAKLYNRAEVPAAGDVFEGDTVTEVITGIENKPGAFQNKNGGKKLTAVEVVDDGIQPLTMKDWFKGCYELAGVEGLSTLDTSKATDMSSMFDGCGGLTSLDLSNFDTGRTGVVRIMFSGCSGLKQVTLKQGWRFSFSSCGLPSTMYVKGGNGSYTEYTGGFPTTKTDTYYTENGIKQAFAVVYDDGNGGRAAKLYNRAKVPAAGDVFEGDTVTEVITGIENKAGAFQDNGGTKLTKVEVVDYGIQPLTMKDWFNRCYELASVEGLSKLDTSKATDMSGMFYQCSGLASLDVSSFDTAKVGNMGSMFSGCMRLTSLDVSKFNTANVGNMSSMFDGCSSLTSLDVSSFDTANVADMSGMFYECSSLTSLDVSKFDTAKVGKMSSMFNGCRGLASLDVSKFNTANVTNMGAMFDGCSRLTSLDLSKFDTAKVGNMSEMFFYCSRLTSLDLSSFDTANVADMSSMFNGCSRLTSLDLSSFDTAKVTNMIRMFYRCSGLTSLDLSKFDTAKVGNMNEMFQSCSSLKQVTLREGWRFKFADCSLPATMYVKDGNGSFAEYTGGFPTTKTDTYYTENGIKQAFAVVYDDGNGGRAAKLYNRAKVPAAGNVFEGDTVTEVITGIENNPGAFQDKSGGKKLTQVKVVDDGIQPTTTKGWFSGCSKLAGVEGLSKLDTSKATDMSSMFAYCGGLTSLDVSKFDTANVTDMSSMFDGCGRLASLDVLGFKTAKVTDMYGMFQGCYGLTSLNVSKFDTANVTDMSCMFNGCWGLTSLDVSKFDTANVTDMSSMFAYCGGLTSLDLSKFDTANVRDMSSMFEQCNKLNTVTFPNDAASKTQLKKALSDCGITLRSNQRTIDEDANALSASDNMESHQCEEGVEHRNLQYEGAAPLSGSTAAAAIIAPSSNVSNAGKTEADSPGQSGGSESKEPSGEKADNCQPDSDGNLSSDKSGSSAHMK